MSAADTPLTKYHPKVCTGTRKHTHKHNKTLININIDCTFTLTKFAKNQLPGKQFITVHPLILGRTDNHTQKRKLISDNIKGADK